MKLEDPARIASLWDSWHGSFLKNCERLCESEPWLDTEELEEKAAEITTQFFYFLEREQLGTYWNTNAWRIDLR